MSGSPFGGSGGAFDPDAGCGATTVGAEQVVVEREVVVETEVTKAKPVALYIMLDKSLSMEWSDLWDPAVDALTGFVEDPASEGFGIALEYFPSGGSCSDGSGYSTPAVDVVRLPEGAKTITDSLKANQANGTSTPIEGALRGVTEFCKSYNAEHPDEQCVAVLVTDGKPEKAKGCSEDDDELAQIAGDAHDDGVTTFAVGLKGADFALLDKIAMQGGAPDCDPNSNAYACDVSDGAEGLRDALELIRDTVTVLETHIETETHVEEQALDCEWQLPEATGNAGFDREKVNVQLTGDGVEVTLGKVPSADDCVENGWHYDHPTEPTRIIACEQTCDLVKSTANAEVGIVLGCPSVVIVE